MRKMSSLCLGTVQFGMPYGINKSSKLPLMNEVEKIFHFFFEKGGKYIDTARDYGKSEKIISNFINNQAKVITKAKLHNKFDFIANDIERSIKNLKVNMIDTLLVHNVEALNEPTFLDQCSKIRETFPVKNIGISIYCATDIKDSIYSCDDLLELDVIQAPFNVMDRRFINSKEFRFFNENKLRIDFRSIFLQGALLSKQNAKKLLPKGLDNYMGRWFNYLDEHNLNPVEAVIGNLPKINKSLTLFGCNSVDEINEIYSFMKKDCDKKFSCGDDIPLNIVDPRSW